MAALSDSDDWRGDELPMRLDTIAMHLRHGDRYWRQHAFTALRLPWESEQPALAQALRALPLAHAEILAADDEKLATFLQPHITDVQALVAATAVPKIAVDTEPQSAPEPYGVPGRKWQQIRAFAACVPNASAPVLEWCAGKAHLGRLLAQRCGCAVTALEWNAELVADGNRLSQRAHLPVSVQHADVLAVQALDYLQREQCVVALHACGDLHLRLLHACAERRPQALLLAPCCYQLSAGECYRPLSHYASANDVGLLKADLRTAVHGTVTSSARVQQQRQQLQSWRLGFDLLQREVRGVDAYLSTPSLPLSTRHQSFAQFCHALAQLKQLELPAHTDFAYYAAAGGERLREVTALDLPRILFRRALEVWLVLDRALWLREHRYAVEVGVFCPRALTPRNLLIRAIAAA